jgi:hypothetical protein
VVTAFQKHLRDIWPGLETLNATRMTLAKRLALDHLQLNSTKMVGKVYQSAARIAQVGLFLGHRRSQCATKPGRSRW